MLKVLLVAPSTLEKIIDTRFVTAPLGCYYLLSHLKKNNHYAEVWDMNIAEETFEEILNKQEWDIIGFSVLESSLEYDLANIHLAKKLSPKSILVAGGTGATLNYQTIFNKSPLDLVIQAEGEYSLVELCRLVGKQGYDNAPVHKIPGVIVRSYAKDYQQVEYTDMRMCLRIEDTKTMAYWKKTASLYENPNYNEINTFRLFTSSYCPMGCAFCTLSRLRKYACGKDVKINYLDVDNIVKLIYKVLKTYPECKQVFFVDDDFFIIKSRTIEFCKEVISLKSRNLLPKDLRFLCLTNINRINKSNIQLIKEAGFKVLSIGVESTSQKVLDSLDKKQTVEKIFEVTKLILDAEIKPYYTLILFAPDSTVEDLVIDLLGFRKLGRMGVGLSVEPYFIPLKGTRLSEEGSPERIRKVKISGTNEYIYKGFSWLPKNQEVYKLFQQFEEIYPKYRKLKFEVDEIGHKEKNYQAYLILNVLEYVLMENNIIPKAEFVRTRNNVYKYIDKIKTMENYTVDVIGNVIKGG